MKIVYDFPPNFTFVRDFFDVNKFQPVFAYGDTIYSPFYKGEIPADLELHETVHSKQQLEFATPDLWWQKYCLNEDFRKNQEILAYAHQYNFIKKNLPKATKDALSDFADNLSSGMYNLHIDHHQAETLIRLKAKELL
jgi:hypothetical protein